MKHELIVFENPKSPVAEMFRTLRTNIQFIGMKQQYKTILITSTFAEEGKSWVSSNLSVSFAQAGRRTLLIDADMRKGRQYKIFSISPTPGLSNYLSGVGIEESKKASDDILDYIQKTDIDNLFVMVAGNIPPNPSELLTSQQMLDLLERAKKEFDTIVIDGTPSQLVADSLILAGVVDATVIVTACKSTKRDDLKRVIVSIQNVGGKIAGVILNKVPISAKKYEQKYYYSSKQRNKDVKGENYNMDKYLGKNAITTEVEPKEEKSEKKMAEKVKKVKTPEVVEEKPKSKRGRKPKSVETAKKGEAPKTAEKKLKTTRTRKTKAETTEIKENTTSAKTKKTKTKKETE